MLISIKPPTAWIGHSPCTLNRQNGALDQTAANDSASALAARVDFLSRPKSYIPRPKPSSHAKHTCDIDGLRACLAIAVRRNRHRRSATPSMPVTSISKFDASAVTRTKPLRLISCGGQRLPRSMS